MCGDVKSETEVTAEDHTVQQCSALHLLCVSNCGDSWVREDNCGNGVVVRLGLRHVVEQSARIETRHQGAENI